MFLWLVPPTTRGVIPQLKLTWFQSRGIGDGLESRSSVMSYFSCLAEGATPKGTEPPDTPGALGEN